MERYEQTAEQLEATTDVKSVSFDSVNVELEVTIRTPNEHWGIAHDPYSVMKEENLVILDVSHVSKNELTAYMKKVGDIEQ